MIPVALFAMSLAPGLLNAAYAAMLVGGCLVATVHLEPPIKTAVLQFSQVAPSFDLAFCVALLGLWDVAIGSCPLCAIVHKGTFPFWST